MRGLPLHPGARDLADDCAVIECGGETLVVTQDTMVEGIHYRSSTDPFDRAWKLVAVNLSDLAAKGAEPVGVLLSYMFGADDARFVEGLKAALERFSCPLLGGDTVGAAAQQCLGLTAIGRASHRPVPSRSGARVGDLVYVTGPIGRAMIGFERDGDGSSEDLSFRRPVPLLDQGRALAPLVTAMMDISDGLLLDSWRLAEASAVTIGLDPEAIPVADEKRFDECLRWGDDYQLLFTADPRARLPVEAHRIGEVRPRQNEAVRLVLGDRGFSRADGLGYRHQARL